MKILIFSTYDTCGGAAKAAFRLHNGLKNIGTESKMLVQVKFSNDTDVIATASKIVKKFPKLRPHVDSLPKLFFRSSDPTKITPFSLQWLPSSIESRVAEVEPDIINLHWVSGGLINIETIAKLKKPIVWTLHDMWAFTGGCHYSQECDRYKESCGNCPQMPPKYNVDLSSWVWQRKENSWNSINGTLVTPSHWLAKCAASSSLLKNWRIEVIPNGLDIEVFEPYNQKLVREKLNLPQGKRLILFGSDNATSNSRKGFHLLQAALERLRNTHWLKECEVIIFGASQPKTSIDLGFKTHYLGRIDNEKQLATIYSAADVMIVPSIQESFGQTASESLACGTPVVAFNSTGLKDIVDHQLNGYLAKPFDVEDLAKGIAWVLEAKDSEDCKLGYHAREKVEREFTLEIQARRYLSLYGSILNKI